MPRHEFEYRLLHDAELRARLGQLTTISQRWRDTAADLANIKEDRDFRIAKLASEGVPLSILAHLVGLSPQRMNSLVKERQRDA